MLLDYKSAPISSTCDSFTGKNTPFTGILMRLPFVFHMIESRKRNKRTKSAKATFIYKKEKQRG
ncbi:hypothetical protein BK718_22480 [Bacillus thuringiensis serovar andalousiensis]|nr:hypothetical protein BK718_22480 [Bacillus thuringiensis serovar andalousiensis]OTZ17140.1 hypothetical protein BK759_22770 [Bacillus thuringiensis serovar aizawai]